jgi:hypothetical protein
MAPFCKERVNVEDADDEDNLAADNSAADADYDDTTQQNRP